MTGLKIGKVTHYFDKIGVAIVLLDGGLSVGDSVKVMRNGEEMFEQDVASIQVEHQKISHAKKGDIVGIKFDKGVKEGAELFKIN